MGVTILAIIVIYVSVLFLISYFTSKGNTDNDAFFLGKRKSPWFIVAFGMIGSSISGVTFVSVPGMVRSQDMTYMQMVLGFFLGYSLIAFILLPLYYKLNLTTIYGYLKQRFGNVTYKTGASFFLLSKTIGAAARLYLVILILYSLIFSQWNIPFEVVTLGTVVLIWLYTFRSGIKTIIWTDTLQTCCLVAALISIIWQLAGYLDLDLLKAIQVISNDEHSRIFVFDDWISKQNFWKQFLSGILIAIVMNGLDQDMMQKSLSCKNLKDAKKNMLTFGFIYIPVNLLFLSLGILILIYASKFAIPLPEKSDEILPLIATEHLGIPVLIFFTIGIVAAAFSSVDSAMTALTTSFCVDLLNIQKEDAVKAVSIRRRVHVLISLFILTVVLIIKAADQSSIINTIYKLASYTYGPLLGLFFFGLFTKINIKDKFVPAICVLALVLSFCLEIFLQKEIGYNVGNEILLFNGLLTVAGLLLLRKTKKLGLPVS